MCLACGIQQLHVYRMQLDQLSVQTSRVTHSKLTFVSCLWNANPRRFTAQWTLLLCRRLTAYKPRPIPLHERNASPRHQSESGPLSHFLHGSGLMTREQTDWEWRVLESTGTPVLSLTFGFSFCCLLFFMLYPVTTSLPIVFTCLPFKRLPLALIFSVHFHCSL